jgi:hypothetical protein
MLTDQKFIKEQVADFGSNIFDSDLEIGNSRLGIGLIMVMSGFLGAWGFICLINGIIQAQNVQVTGRGIITAFTGL